MEQFVIIAAGLVALAHVAHLSAARLRAQVVAARLGALGDLRASTKPELVAAVGAPDGQAALASGGEVLDWRAPGFELTVMFDARGRCVGISRLVS
jgi:hypothetical protein